MKLAASTPGLEGSPTRGADDAYLSGGLIPGNPLSSYRILPCTAAMAEDSWNCPYMPRQGGNYLHTRKGGMFCYNDAASRPVPKSEIRLKEEAQKAMDFEWKRLVDKKCFDFSCVFWYQKC